MKKELFIFQKKNLKVFTNLNKFWNPFSSMDQKDLYNQLKNAFLLGNYHKVFEFLKTYPLEEQNLLYKEDICCLIARSFIALEERKTSEIESFMNGSPDLKKMLNFLSPYLVPLLKVKKKIINI